MDRKNTFPSKNDLQNWFTKLTSIPKNKYHPLVWIVGKPKIGKNVIIGGFSEIQANHSTVKIGDNCDIASFVAINTADSHQKCIGLNKKIDRGKIILERNVFIGSHSVISGNIIVGHHSVVAAGTILVGNYNIEPYSLVIGNPAKIKKNYFKKNEKKNNKT